MKGVVVLGMHRSGTSALTRVVSLLGAAVPAPGDLLSDYDNPDGHWESRSLVACNDRILGLFGRSWDFPPRLPEGWECSPGAEAMVPELRRSFDAAFPEGPWVWKDPRTCLTFPLWRRALGEEDICVLLVFRSATAVARSIHRRDRIPRLYGAGLWLQYLARSLRGAAGLPVLCVHFEDFLDDPAGATSSLQAGLVSLGLVLAGDVEAAAASLHGAAPGPEAAGPLDHLVGRATARGSSLAASLPGASAVFAPPPFGVPRWVRPAQFAYRAQWALRARAGHPLVRFPPDEAPAEGPSTHRPGPLVRRPN